MAFEQLFKVHLQLNRVAFTMSVHDLSDRSDSLNLAFMHDRESIGESLCNVNVLSAHEESVALRLFPDSLENSMDGSRIDTLKRVI